MSMNLSINKLNTEITKNQNRLKQKILDSILFRSKLITEYLKTKGYTVGKNRWLAVDRTLLLSFTTVVTFAECFKDDEEAIAFLDKTPLGDFGLKMKKGEKCNVIPVWFNPYVDLSDENNVKKNLTTIENTPCFIPKTIKIEDEHFSAPIWDYYVFVGCSETNGGLYAFVMGYISKKDLSSNKIVTERGEWKFREGDLKTELNVWEFKVSELRSFPEIENLITSEIVAAPETKQEKREATLKRGVESKIGKNYFANKVFATASMLDQCVPKNSKDNKKTGGMLTKGFPPQDFAIKMRNGKKCDVIPIPLPPNLHIHSDSDCEKVLPLISRIPYVIPKSSKCEGELFLMPIWDYYIFVGLSVHTDDGSYCCPILGYVSKENLLPSKIVTTKEKTPNEIGVEELTVWKFTVSELRHISEIRNLITSEIIAPPKPPNERNNINKQN